MTGAPAVVGVALAAAEIWYLMVLFSPYGLFVWAVTDKLQNMFVCLECICLSSVVPVADSNSQETFGTFPRPLFQQTVHLQCESLRCDEVVATTTPQLGTCA